MIIAEEYSLSQGNYSQKRISLKQYQCIRHKWSLTQIFSGLGLVLIVICVILFPEESEKGLTLIKKQEIGVIYSSEENNVQNDNKLASTYLDSFCHATGCQQNDTEMIISLIQLMNGQQTWIEKFASSNPAKQNLTFPVVVKRKVNLQINNSLHGNKVIDWRQLMSSFSRHTLKEVQLFAVKRLKLTTPKHTNNQLIDIFWSIFGFHDQYHGINRLFHDGNIIWEINVPYSSITIASHSQIQPQMLELDFVTDSLETLTILGLSINLRKEIFNVITLGSYNLSQGLNKIHCSLEECSERYSMIRLVFSKMRIKSIKLYQLDEL